MKKVEAILTAGIVLISAFAFATPAIAQQNNVMDNKAPTIIFIPPTPVDGVEVTGNNVVVNVSISDDDVANVWLDWNETKYILLASGNITEESSSEYIYTYNVTNLTNGEYTYKVFANDTCEKLGVSETRNVLINATRPNSVLPPLPFVINGYVFYEDSTPCLNPSVNITNVNTDKKWIAETYEHASYYQSVNSTVDEMAGDTLLRSDAKSPDETQSKTTNYTVTQADVEMGGKFEFNITLESVAVPEYTLELKASSVIDPGNWLNPENTFMPDDAYANATEITTMQLGITNAATHGNITSVVIKVEQNVVKAGLRNLRYVITPVFNGTPDTGSTRIAGTTTDSNLTFDITAQKEVWSWDDIDTLDVRIASSKWGPVKPGDTWNVDYVAVVVNYTAAAPNITSWAPVEAIVYNTAGEPRTFNITVDQVVNVSWKINGYEISNESNKTESAYTNDSAAIGEWDISVRVENVNGTDMHEWMWHVYEPEVRTITVSPGFAALKVNETQLFTATAFDQYDEPMAGINITWTSCNENVGTLSPSWGITDENGNATTTFTANATGWARIKAANITTRISDTAWVHVYEPEVSTIEVEPSEASVPVEGTQVFTAIAFDQEDEPMAGINITWTSWNEKVGTLSPSWGITDENGNAATTFTANATGRTLVVAGNATIPFWKRGYAFVTVYEPEVTNITVSPSAVELRVGKTQPFTATAYDQHEKVMPNVTFNWSVSNMTVGTVNETGFFEALVAGDTLVNATADSVTGSAFVDVEEVPPEITIEYNLIKKPGSTGKNWISIPITTTITNASSLMAAIGPNCDAVNRWNATTQQPEGWISLGGGMGTSFNIVAGEGYEISVTANTTFNLTGVPISIDPISLIKKPDSTGKNWIGLPYDTTITNASSLMAAIGPNCDAVNRWNATTQQPEGWISLGGGMGTSFNIVAGEGYEISVTTNTTWTPI